MEELLSTGICKKKLSCLSTFLLTTILLKVQLHRGLSLSYLGAVKIPEIIISEGCGGKGANCTFGEKIQCLMPSYCEMPYMQ